MMSFGKRIKQYRANLGLSQEQLAEKLGVSRQAITKWETGRGMPDVKNMIILAKIFHVTLDELILQKKEEPISSHFFESETIYDIDGSTHFDIHVGNARKIYIYSCNNEKVHIKLLSDSLDDLGSFYKVKIDERKKRLDIECRNKRTISHFQAENSLDVIILLPYNYVEHCEISASVKELHIKNIKTNRLEYDGVADSVYITDVEGSLEFTGKEDYKIIINGTCTHLDINQWRAKSLIYISDINKYTIINNGRKSKIYHLNNGVISEEIPDIKGNNIISVSSIKSETIICN